MKKACLRGKRTSAFVGTFLLGVVLLTTSARAVNFVEFQRSLGGKGSGLGGFSTKINLGFDAEQNIYVSDADSRVIQKISADGQFVWQYPAADAETLEVVLVAPGDITVDSGGFVYVADTTVVPIPGETSADRPPIYIFTPCVHKFDGAGKFVKTVPVDAPDALPKSPAIPVREIVDGSGRYALAIQAKGFDRAVRVDTDSQGNLFVLDAERPSRQVVIKFSSEGARLKTFGRYGAGDGEFDSPKDLAVGTDGGVFVADTGNHRIVKFDNDGGFLKSFASRGYGSNELTSPSYIAATLDNQILVKDDSTFVRKELRSIPLEILSLSLFSGGQRSLRPNLTDNPLNKPLTASEELALRLRRLEELTLMDTQDKTEQKDLEDTALKTAVQVGNTLYHTNFQRVLRFDNEGNYKDTATWRIDPLDEQLNDLTFVAADPLANVYLQDKSDHTLRKYRVVGFSLRPQDIDTISSSRFTTENNKYVEDYEDLDQDPDADNDEDVMTGRQRLLFNFDMTPRWNFLVEDTARFSGRDGNQEYPEKIEDGLTFKDRNYDNDLYVGIRRVMNPNPYRYKELNLFIQRQDGSSALDTDALYPTLNRQRGRQEGDSSATLFGADWDILRNANLQLQYFAYNPIETSRNYTREFYDLQGNLYQVLRSRNENKTLVAELNLKF